jgi:hypothetical protein
MQATVALNPQPQSKHLIATAGRDKFIRVCLEKFKIFIRKLIYYKNNINI